MREAEARKGIQICGEQNELDYVENFQRNGIQSYKSPKPNISVSKWKRCSPFQSSFKAATEIYVVSETRLIRLRCNNAVVSLQK